MSRFVRDELVRQLSRQSIKLCFVPWEPSSYDDPHLESICAWIKKQLSGVAKRTGLSPDKALEYMCHRLSQGFYEDTFARKYKFHMKLLAKDPHKYFVSSELSHSFFMEENLRLRGKAVPAKATWRDRVEYQGTPVLEEKYLAAQSMEDVMEILRGSMIDPERKTA